MRRSVEVLNGPGNIPIEGMALARPGWMQNALAIAAGVGFAVFLFGLALSPLGSTPRRRQRPARRNAQPLERRSPRSSRRTN